MASSAGSLTSMSRTLRTTTRCTLRSVSSSTAPRIITSSSITPHSPTRSSSARTPRMAPSLDSHAVMEVRAQGTLQLDSNPSNPSPRWVPPSAAAPWSLKLSSKVARTRRLSSSGRTRAIDTPSMKRSNAPSGRARRFHSCALRLTP